MSHYKKALEKIRDNCGKVCEQYEICEHEACQSSYNSWAIADEALNQKSMFRIWIIGLTIITFIFLTFALYRIQEISKRQERQHSMLQKKVQDLELEKDRLKMEFDSYKNLTSDEFVRTWQSFGVIRNNFLALGTGKFLCDDDVMSDDESDDDEKE